MNAFLIFLGGGLGALSRWGLSTGLDKLASRTSIHHFPLGILACNLLGCFLIGCIFGHLTQRHPKSFLKGCLPEYLKKRNDIKQK